VRTRLLAILAPIVLLLACAVGPDFHRPAAPADRPYTREVRGRSDRAPSFRDGGVVAGDWWRILQCPALDAVVGEALASNPGLEAARATLRQSQNSLRGGYGVFFPQANAQAGVSRQLYNPAPATLPSSTFNLFTVAGSVSYTVDLWGGNRRQVEILGAAVDSQRYALAAAYVMLTSNVVNAVIAQSAYRAEIEATQSTIALLREQVHIADVQATSGVVPYSNVLTLQSQLASTLATLPPLEQKIDQVDDLLAALTGRVPADYKERPVLLADLQLPSDLPLSIPSQLVRQRPDILVAEAELHAANANIGVATAAMLPNITLSASYGFNNSSPGSLLSAGSPFWSLGAGLVQPIFHGGALYYQRKAAIDARDAAAAEYRQTVLAAFEQVVDTLRALGHDADSLSAQIVAVETSEKAMHLIDANYHAGIATYLQVLIADGQYLQAKTSYVQAVAQRLQDTVTLYVALGGGWWTTPAASHG